MNRLLVGRTISLLFVVVLIGSVQALLSSSLPELENPVISNVDLQGVEPTVLIGHSTGLLRIKIETLTPDVIESLNRKSEIKIPDNWKSIAVEKLKQDEERKAAARRAKVEQLGPKPDGSDKLLMERVLRYLQEHVNDPTSVQVLGYGNAQAADDHWSMEIRWTAKNQMGGGHTFTDTVEITKDEIQINLNRRFAVGGLFPPRSEAERSVFK